MREHPAEGKEIHIVVDRAVAEAAAALAGRGDRHPLFSRLTAMALSSGVGTSGGSVDTPDPNDNCLQVPADDMRKVRLNVAGLPGRLTLPEVNAETRAYLRPTGSLLQPKLTNEVVRALRSEVSTPILSVLGTTPDQLKAGLLDRDAELSRVLEGGYLFRLRAVEGGLVLDSVQATIADLIFADYEAELATYPPDSPEAISLKAAFAEAVAVRARLQQERADAANLTISNRAAELKGLENASADMLLSDVLLNLNLGQEVSADDLAAAAAHFEGQQGDPAQAADQAYANASGAGQAKSPKSKKKPPKSKK